MLCYLWLVPCAAPINRIWIWWSEYRKDLSSNRNCRPSLSHSVPNRLRKRCPLVRQEKHDNYAGSLSLPFGLNDVKFSFWALATGRHPKAEFSFSLGSDSNLNAVFTVLGWWPSFAIHSISLGRANCELKTNELIEDRNALHSCDCSSCWITRCIDHVSIITRWIRVWIMWPEMLWVVQQVQHNVFGIM